MRERFVIVTNCTARKRAGVALAQLRPTGESGGVEALATCWRETLASSPPALPAGRLYVGRSIIEAKTTAEALDSRLFVVSAGLGLVASDQMVPGYDLSVAGNDTGLLRLLQARGASTSHWWREISKSCGLPRLIFETSPALVLVALPTSYLELLREDFADLSADSRSRLRVFTSTSGRKVLADFPDIPVMPYDERLESLQGFAGTRADFPQRAMRHFVTRLKAHLLDAAAASSYVKSALASCSVPVVPMRRRLDDAELCALIKHAWTEYYGNSARLLRYLRDTENVACEQGRFALLRRRVADELAAETQLQTLEAKNVI